MTPETFASLIAGMAAPIQARAAELFIDGVNFSDLSIVTEGGKVYLCAHGKPDSLFWIDDFGLMNCAQVSNKTDGEANK